MSYNDSKYPQQTMAGSAMPAVNDAYSGGRPGREVDPGKTIPSMIEGISQLINTLREEAEVLRSNLSPILVDSKAERTLPPLPPAQSVLAGDLGEMYVVLLSAITVIRDINTRLDI